MAGKKWTDQELNILKENFTKVDKVSDILLQRSEKSIYLKAHQLGLKRGYNKDSLKNLLNGGKKYRFKKNHTPANKGKKWDDFISKEKQEKIKQTCFQKGDVPHTAKHNETPYVYTRVRKNGRIEKYWFIYKFGDKRRPYLRQLYEQNIGKIPKGYIVTFVDEPFYDKVPTIDDIKIISRKKNLARNSGYEDITEKYAKNNLRKMGIEEPTKAMILLKQQQLKIEREWKKILKN